MPGGSSWGNCLIRIDVTADSVAYAMHTVFSDHLGVKFAFTQARKRAGSGSPTVKIRRQCPAAFQAPVSVFPNPVTSRTRLSIRGLLLNRSISIHITDNLGRMVGTYRYSDLIVSGNETGYLPFNGSALSNGVYLVRVGNGKSRVCRKIVVAK